MGFWRQQWERFTCPDCMGDKHAISPKDKAEPAKSGAATNLTNVIGLISRLRREDYSDRDIATAATTLAAQAVEIVNLRDALEDQVQRVANTEEVEWLRLALAGAAFCKHSGGIFWTWNKNLSVYGYFYALPDDNLTCHWGGTTLNDVWHAIGLAIREES